MSLFLLSLLSFFSSLALPLVMHLFPFDISFVGCGLCLVIAPCLYLQEETVRLRKNVAQLSSPAVQASSPSVSPVPTQAGSENLPPMAVAYLVLALIFGIIIGKFIL